MSYYYDSGMNYTNPFYNNVPPQAFIQPQMQQPVQNCQCDNRFMWIQGKEAAKAYPVAPDKTIFFLDDKESYAYLKKTDREGKTVEFKTFQLIEEKDTPVQAAPEESYISKDEFDTFSKNVDQSLNELKEMILSTQRYNKPQYNKGKQVNSNG